MHVSRIPELAESLVAPVFPAASATTVRTSTSTTSSRCVRTACAAPARPRSTLPTWPPGGIEGFWEFNLNPWDTAAGILLVEEAGGKVTDFAGGPFRLDSREVLATNGLIHDELVACSRTCSPGASLARFPSPEEYAARRLARSGS